MKTARRELLETLERLPDDASMETLLAELHFKASVLRGLEDARRGDVVSHEEVRSRLNKWLESLVARGSPEPRSHRRSRP